MKAANVIGKLMSEGIAHHAARRLPEAVARYSRVLELRADHGEAWRLLGVAALQSGDNATARLRLERALHINPRDAAARSALGNVEESEGRLERAAAAYTAALATDPDQEAAVQGFLRVALVLGRAAEAIPVARKAVARGTRDAGFLRTFGAALLLVRDFSGAAQAFEAALRSVPHADTYAYLAVAYVHLGRCEDAAGAAQQALELDPGHSVAALHLGTARLLGADFAAALTAFERAVALGLPAARVNLGSTRLLLGEYRNGWPEFSWDTAARRAGPVYSALPMWDGTPAAQTRLLVWHEQGVGDSIQLARFLRLARHRVGSLTFACPPGTAGLFGGVDGVDAVLDLRPDLPFATFDAWLPTVRLPQLFDITLASIPAEPYLRADPARVARFAPRLAAPGTLRVGLVWSGNTEYEWNHERSCALNDLAPLSEVPAVTFFALQQGEPREQPAPSGMRVVPINREVTDFADSAAIIAQLDLVITVDTSVAHLAGALGRPAWVLLSEIPSWRWGLAGERSPWYPTLRLFRRRDGADWAPAIARVAAALRDVSPTP